MADAAQSSAGGSAGNAAANNNNNTTGSTGSNRVPTSIGGRPHGGSRGRGNTQQQQSNDSANSGRGDDSRRSRGRRGGRGGATKARSCSKRMALHPVQRERGTSTYVTISLLIGSEAEKLESSTVLHMIWWLTSLLSLCREPCSTSFALMS